MSRLVDEDSPLAKAWRPHDPESAKSTALSRKEEIEAGCICPGVDVDNWRVGCVVHPSPPVDDLARWHRDR